MSNLRSALEPDVPPPIDFRLSANLFQAFLIVPLSLVGAMAGYQLAVDRRWIAAAAGGFLGMIVATFVSGFILMFFPQAIATIEIETSTNKYRILRRRFTFLTTCYLILATVAVVWFALSLPLIEWLIGSWSFSILVCYVFLQYNAYCLGLWRCPNCVELFGRRGVFERYPHCCSNCGFSVDRDDDGVDELIE